jgi:O-succinylbenzoate synthase
MQNLRASFHSHTLEFKTPATTSRDTLRTKPTWYLKVWDENNPEIFGLGECSPLWGLSIESPDRYESDLTSLCEHIDRNEAFDFSAFPSLRFGYETALLDLQNGGSRTLFDTGFSRGDQGIEINGLVWMGPIEQMREQMLSKIESGFTCIKLKIGALDWNKEHALLKELRSSFGKNIELRVDANGAFNSSNVFEVLDALARLEVHSIEQPVAAGNPSLMKKVCAESPVPIALDEELIKVVDTHARMNLLDELNPQYIILKPSLIGGLFGADEWINLATERGIGWWATSALESNIGLNAIAQWVSNRQIAMPQGLGTGGLFVNNIPSPLSIRKDQLWLDNAQQWNLEQVLA